MSQRRSNIKSDEKSASLRGWKRVKEEETSGSPFMYLSPCPPCHCFNDENNYAESRCHLHCPFHQWIKSTIENN